ncbi:photosystem I reaction center subunit VIII [Pelatocladus sp. BLCC-F211]|nr:photosystem I reaction center subunit VIII [Fischerella sp. CENA71]RAM53341.1 MAG: photosystem I reaction center subunit VIII [Hapalosiphonaceae cyanobacterium JJU2]TBR58541.1 photosystem I reaction center subunit VIII [Westiellopsis prolifica IICB1]TFI52856.1 photosystem I reaction center subunit VIII [Mastigocladus laminosus UU774]
MVTSLLASYPASFLSPILVYSIGWIVPIVVFSFLLIYIEREDIA